MAKRRTVRKVVIRTFDDLRDWLQSQLIEGWDLYLHVHVSVCHYRGGSRHQSDRYSMRIANSDWDFEVSATAGTPADLARKYQFEVVPAIHKKFDERESADRIRKIGVKQARLTYDPPEPVLFK